VSQAVEASSWIEQLRAGNPASWAQLNTLVVERVLAAVERRCGHGPARYTLADVGQSVLRTVQRRLHDRDDPKLESLETTAELLNWLVQVAHHKFVDVLRRLAVERKHFSELARRAVIGDNLPADVLEQLSDETSDVVLKRLQTYLRDDVERCVFGGKLAGQTYAEMAAGLNCSTRKVVGVWERIRKRLVRESGDRVE
jgi:DNA-directed RNA polymerase specialized sigma24 family protein